VHESGPPRAIIQGGPVLYDKQLLCIGGKECSALFDFHRRWNSWCRNEKSPAPFFRLKRPAQPSSDLTKEAFFYFKKGGRLPVAPNRWVGSGD